MLKYYIKKLKNGLTVFIINTKKLSSLDITLYVRVGSIYENKENNGISHLLEHLLFLKTKQLKSSQVGLDIYPYTQKDFTYFEITTHKDLAGEALSAVSSAVLLPEFTRNNLKIIKKIVLEEIMEYCDNPYEVFNQKIDQYLYKNSSLALDVAGSKEKIRVITADDLKNWYEKYYIPENMILTLAGDINVNATIKQINKLFHFNNFKSKAIDYPENISGKIIYPKVLAKPIKFINHNFQQAYLTFVFPASGINDSKYIYNVLLAELLNRKMRQKLENSGLFYNIELDYRQYLNTGEFRIITACNKKNINKAAKELITFVNNVKISEHFFKDIKNYIRYQFMLKEDSVDELSSLSLYLLAGRFKLITIEDETKKIKNISYEEMFKIKEKIFNKNYYYFFIMN